MSCEKNERLRSAEAVEAPLFSLSGQEHSVRVVGIYDGDTVTVVLPVHDHLYKFKARLDGIDTPEMKSSSEDERKKAVAARNRLFDLVTGGGVGIPKSMDEYLEKNPVIVYVECKAFDKYGRLLVEMYPTSGKVLSFQQMLIHEGHGYVYHGGTKMTAV